MSKGKCYLCNGVYTNKGITTHTKKCIEKNLNVKSNFNNENSYLLKVQDQYDKSFYLLLLVDNCVLLSEIDSYLRKIWLDCCSHLSRFIIDDDEYHIHSDYQWGETLDMNYKTEDVLYPGLSFSYEYDFGSTSRLVLKIMGTYNNTQSEKGIRLIGRNILENQKCDKCDEIAVCTYEDLDAYSTGILCISCQEKRNDPTKKISFGELYNSPRTGICAYQGPADDIMFMPHKPIKKVNKKKINPINRIKDEKGGKEIISFIDNLNRTQVPLCQPFVIKANKLKSLELDSFLNALTKNELNHISKMHGMSTNNKMKKNELVICIKNFLLKKMLAILTYIPSIEYAVLMDVFAQKITNVYSDEEIPIELYLLQQLGLLFIVDDNSISYELYLPDEFYGIFQTENLFESLAVKRDLTDAFVNLVPKILFYWGIADTTTLMNECGRLLEKSVDDVFSYHFSKVLSYIKDEYLNFLNLGITDYYYSHFVKVPDEILISDSWQNTNYPIIDKELVIDPALDIWDLIINNIYFKIFYESSLETTDEFEDENDIMDATNTFAHIIYNLHPEETLKDFAEIMGISYKKFMSWPLSIIVKNMRLYSPNYWMKGNSISGELHFECTNAKNMSNIEIAASKWKIGRNDPCPCGSGKKHMKCCAK